MDKGVFKKVLHSLEKKGDTLTNSRNTEHNFWYNIHDALKCAFGVFFFQHRSMLDFQRQMQEQHRRSNIDRIEPDTFGGVFNEILRIADDYKKVLDSYRVLDGGVLIALDGVVLLVGEDTLQAVFA